MTGVSVPPPPVLPSPATQQQPEWTATVPRQGRSNISRLPYLPGLDGLRAVAVVAVIVYHANSEWLSGGFLGVEVFFVISGYLITMLLIAEHERSDHVSLAKFWLRRAKRLLPALFLMMTMLVVYTWIFRSDELGALRGDVVAGFFYVTNWFQIWTGEGYTDAASFAPLRHLWSLAVEEQFYLVWPLVMAALLARKGRRIAGVFGWFVLAALLVTVVMAVAYHPGQIGACADTPAAYWDVGDRCIDKANTLYLSTITRSSGLLLGAAFAMLWRPYALMRGPIREKGPLLDMVALLGLLGLAGLVWSLHIVGNDLAADALLFRGGFLLTGLATLALIAAVTHAGTATGRVFGNPVFVWVGTRSYGLYLYHWPIFQIIRDRAGERLTPAEFALAMAVTLVITELSYRLVEMPIRNGQAARWWNRMRSQRDPTPRRAIATGGALAATLVLFAGVNLATAEVKPNDIQASLRDAAESTCNPVLEDCGADPAEGGGGDPGGEGGSGGDLPEGGGGDGTTGGVNGTAGSEEPDGQAPVATSSSQPDDDSDDASPSATAAEPPDGDENSNGANQNPDAGNRGGDGSGRGNGERPNRTTTTSVPRKVVERYALGDSVMLGAADALKARGFVVDAEVSRSFGTGLEQVSTLREQDRLGEIVVVHLGANDTTITTERLDEMMAMLSEVDQVLFVTVRLNQDFVFPLNQRIRELEDRYVNVRVLDWAEVGNSCGGCFASDNLHLNSTGADYYAEKIAEAVGIG